PGFYDCLRSRNDRQSSDFLMGHLFPQSQSHQIGNSFLPAQNQNQAFHKEGKSIRRRPEYGLFYQ
ncbi:MAG: hypothetical protein AAGU16_14915, partial [Desulfitobacterium hafniense]